MRNESAKATFGGEGASDPSTPVIRIAWVFACAFACLGRGVIERDPFQLGKGTWNLRKQTQFAAQLAASAVARTGKRGNKPNLVASHCQNRTCHHATQRHLQESSAIFNNVQESSGIFSSPGSPA
jgi:hypothetical protein